MDKRVVVGGGRREGANGVLRQKKVTGGRGRGSAILRCSAPPRRPPLVLIGVEQRDAIIGVLYVLTV
jgi:hypothetical protein